MTVLRVDPWDPDFGASIESDEDPDRPPPPVEFDEPVAWTGLAPEPLAELPCCAFVDGVRRVDLHMFAEDGDVVAPAIAGSWAVGAAWTSQPPEVADVRVKRVIVVGNGLDHPPLSVTIGGQELAFEPSSAALRTPRELLQKLQQLMREGEAALSEAIAERGQADLIVQDGPLTYTGRGRTPAVGMIKRQTQRYLEPDRQSLLGSLTVGQRTPIFRFESRELPRYSWYTRISEPRSIDGRMAGLVRLEVGAGEDGMGGEDLDTARRLADLTASTLPRFAAPMWRDSRSPQNLYPVGQLETVLRNRLGERDLVRRGLETALWRTMNE